MKAILLSIAMAAFSNSWEMTESVVPDTCAECEKYCNDILCLGTCFKKDKISQAQCALADIRIPKKLTVETVQSISPLNDHKNKHSYINDIILEPLFILVSKDNKKFRVTIRSSNSYFCERAA